MSFVGQPRISEHNLRPKGERYLYSKTEYFFNLQDLDRLRPLVGPLVPGQVRRRPGEGEVAQDRRDSSVFFIEPTKDSAWLYEKIGDALRHHNQTYYGYDIQGIEHLQFTEYAAPGQYYGPHLDWGSGQVMGRGDICRKLSFTVQLSNPESYEGGDFRVENGEDFAAQSAGVRPFGTLIVFPSFVLHEVTPVTAGVRRSLVGWAIGPDFR